MHDYIVDDNDYLQSISPSAQAEVVKQPRGTHRHSQVSSPKDIKLERNQAYEQASPTL